MLNIWILTLWVLPAKVCYPAKEISGQLPSILKTALGLDSWGLTLTEHGHHVKMGGFSLVSPRNFLLFHHGTLFLHYLSEPHGFAVETVPAFELWCDSRGLNFSLTHLPTLQMAVVQWSALNIIGLSCKAYSKLTSCLPVALNGHVTVGDIPLFHNTMFHNELTK